MLENNKIFDNHIKFGDFFTFLSEEITNQKILIVTSKSFSERGVISLIKNCLKTNEIKILDEVKQEPTIQLIESYIAKYSKYEYDLIISIGGGSVTDSAKILSVLLHQDNQINLITDFHKTNFVKNITLYSLPTTAGSGAELTSFATLWDCKSKIKHSFQNKLLLPKLAFYDYKFLKSMSYSVSVSSGLDTISHAFESIWNKFADPLSISLSTQSLTLSINSIREYVQIEKTTSSLKNMQLASILAALAIARTKTGIAHSISYPLTAIYKIPHGIASSFVLPEVLLFNAEKDDGRLKTLSEMLGYPSIEKLYLELINLRHELLSKLEIIQILRSIDINLIQKKIITPSRAELNFRDVNENEAIKILKNAIKRIT